MDSLQLRAFVTIAEVGKISLAAERLFISQPSLTRYLQALERDLGAALFERTRGRRQLLLTPVGTVFLEGARTILAEIDRVQAQVEEVKAETSDSFRVASSTTAMRDFVVPTVKELKQVHPDCKVQLIETDYGSELDFVERDAAEVAIGAPVLDLSNVDWDALYTTRFYALACPTHHLASKSSVTVDELADEHLLFYNNGQRLRASFEFVRSIHGLSPKSFFESRMQETLLSLAEAGLGVALLPDTVRFRGYKLKAIPVIHNGRHIEIQRVVAWHRDRRHPPAIRDFIRLLKESAANREIAGYVPLEADHTVAISGMSENDDLVM